MSSNPKTNGTPFCFESNRKLNNEEEMNKTAKGITSDEKSKFTLAKDKNESMSLLNTSLTLSEQVLISLSNQNEINIDNTATFYREVLSNQSKVDFIFN